jgi:hypothetical protein
MTKICKINQKTNHFYNWNLFIRLPVWRYWTGQSLPCYPDEFCKHVEYFLYILTSDLCLKTHVATPIGPYCRHLVAVFPRRNKTSVLNYQDKSHAISLSCFAFFCPLSNCNFKPFIEQTIYAQLLLAHIVIHRCNILSCRQGSTNIGWVHQETNSTGQTFLQKRSFSWTCLVIVVHLPT